MDPPLAPCASLRRNLLFLATPALWPVWPFLPLIRRRPDGGEDYGVLYDCWTKAGRPGFRATVFLTNLFELPPSEDELLVLPREVFDSPEEIVAAGWRID